MAYNMLNGIGEDYQGGCGYVETMESEDGETMSLPPQERGGLTTIVRQQSGDQLLVSACGRTCSVDMHHTRSIQDLQAALQHKLQMDGQIFHICDINGQLLSTDMQVSDAIAQGLTPLCATLPDKSLHHLENRREELAQMQWKLVRDQMNGHNNGVTNLTRQVNELTFEFKNHHREMSTIVERCKLDTMHMCDNERITTKSEMHAVQEAVNGAVLLINGERGKRELAVQGFEKHIHGVCDMLDGERASRRQDLAMHMSVIEELRAEVQTERNARAQLEEVVLEHKRSTGKFQDEVRATLQDQGDKISNVQSDVGISVSEMMGRFTELEDRMGLLENSMSEITSWTTGSLDRVTERHERVSQLVETMRLSHKPIEGSIGIVLERTEELDKLVRQHECTMSTRDELSKEKQVRDDQVRRVSTCFTNDSLKNVTELEKRLTVRLERESAEREKNYSTLIDEVSKICEDRKLFRDQTITKTIQVPTVPVLTGLIQTSGIAQPQVSFRPPGSVVVPVGSYQPPPSVVVPMGSYRPPASYQPPPSDATTTREIRTAPISMQIPWEATAGQMPPPSPRNPPSLSYTGIPASQGGTPQNSPSMLQVPASPYGSLSLTMQGQSFQQGYTNSDLGSRSGSVRAAVGSGNIPLNMTGSLQTLSPRVPVAAMLPTSPRVGQVPYMSR